MLDRSYTSGVRAPRDRIRVCGRRVRTFVALASVISGCGGRDPSSPTPDVVGTYALVSADGRPLPAPFGDSTVIAADVYVLDNAGNYTYEGRTQFVDGTRPQTLHSSGTWRLIQSGARIELTAVTARGIVYVTAMEVRDGGRELVRLGRDFTWVYRR